MDLDKISGCFASKNDDFDKFEFQKKKSSSRFFEKVFCYILSEIVSIFISNSSNNFPLEDGGSRERRFPTWFSETCVFFQHHASSKI